ncbi:hypothetical protein Riv7116_0862 [Rivularia sp. PCC 7116]|uniref:hypothetical protein n=1 Tax=Rivularia sp. PCC 7116 TaxID=373994 RepID=UPI00029F16AE|nr:hypothetical protein [Rivularia sp. PCC 7116]AFY53443.1 hypothetical protein Riv7116_0862 [Rivularia sp. PCC 7116]
MKRFIKSCLTISAFSSLLIAPIVLSAGEASAQPRRSCDYTYVGGGIGAQVTNGGQDNDAANVGGNIQGSLPVGGTPIDVKTKVLWNNDATAINPEVAAGTCLGSRTKVYGAVGYSFVEQDGKSTPLGNKDSVTASVGVESQVKKGIVVYSNATVALDGYENTSAIPVNVGGGVGFNW